MASALSSRTPLAPSAVSGVGLGAQWRSSSGSAAIPPVRWGAPPPCPPSKSSKSSIFSVCPGQHHGQAVGADTDHLAAEDDRPAGSPASRAPVGPTATVTRTQFVLFDRLRRRELAHGHDVDQLVEPHDPPPRAAPTPRPPRWRRGSEPRSSSVGATAREYMLKPSTAEQPGHPGQDAGLVLDQTDKTWWRGTRGLAALEGLRWGGRHRRAAWSGASDHSSSLYAPAGTMASTFSKVSGAVVHYTGRSSMAFAFSITGPTSSGDSAAMPTQPIASAHFT